jgi:two-component system sensor histidine kinase ChvG
MMEIVLQNVLENAISFSPAGSKIAVSLRVSADTVELTVDDEGPGIETDKIDSVFQRYFSLRPEDGIGSDRAVEHSGLGLWIVRRNVEALGGQADAANRPGGGLSIRMLLPRFVIH